MVKFRCQLKVVFVAVFAFVAFSSCSNETDNPVNPSSDVEYFPNQVGNTWTYQIPIEADTATGQAAGFARSVVSITGETEILDGIPVSIWVRTSPDSKICPECQDTTFVFANETRAKFIERVEVSRDSLELQVVAEFKFPFRADETWDWTPFTDEREPPIIASTGKTLRTTTIEVGAGTFTSAHLITLESGGINSTIIPGKNGFYWFAPQIGIISFVKGTGASGGGAYSTPDEFADRIPKAFTSIADLGPPEFKFTDLTMDCDSIHDLNGNGFLDIDDLASCDFFRPSTSNAGSVYYGRTCDTLFDQNGNGFFDEADAIGCDFFTSPLFYDIEDTFVDPNAIPRTLPQLWELQTFNVEGEK